MEGGSRDATRTPRTVHILGDDRRARFLACELQQVYDSVHVFKSVNDKMVDFKFEPAKTPEASATTDPKQRQQEQLLSPTTSETPISKLITTARAVDTVSAIDQLKGRISDQTTLCLLNDGLGLAEELNETVFNEDKGAKPEYLLGRLDRVYLKREPRKQERGFLDRPLNGNTRGFLHVHPDVKAEVSPYDPTLSTRPDESPLASSLVDELRSSPNLHVKVQAYHNWLQLRLQDMIFCAVVDPVATIVGCRYNEVTSVKSAIHLMMMLLDEIRRIIAVMPEAEGSRNIRRMAEGQDGQYLRKTCLAWVRKMGPIHSKMATHIHWGWKADINSHNGYFIRRAKELGVECPYNEMVVAMVKAKHGMRLKELQNQVPFEVTSRPHGAMY